MNTNKFQLFIFLFLISYQLFAQNLVLNPSFENKLLCPDKNTSLGECATEWSTATWASPDYFHTCSKKMNIPKTKQGYQEAKFGNAFIGLQCYVPSEIYAVEANYREYVIGTLSETLIKGREYEVSFYINLTDYSSYAVKEFGVLFSENKFYLKTRKEIPIYKTIENSGQFKVLRIRKPAFYTNKKEWVKLSATFIASGFENYIVIGNFNDNMTTESLKLKKKFSKPMAYYFIDMISVESNEISSTRHKSKRKDRKSIDYLLD